MRLRGLTVEECRESLAEAISLILEDRREAIMRKGKTGNDARSSLELILSHANEQSSDSVELEYVPEGLEITYMFGNTGVGTIVKDGQEIREIIDAVVKLKRKLRGRQGYPYEDRRYKIGIEKYESFGEAAFRIRFTRVGEG